MIKNTLSLSITVSFVLSFIIFVSDIAYAAEKYLDGQILVKYKNGLSERSRYLIARQTGCSRRVKFRRFEAELIDLPPGISVDEGVRRFKFYPRVEIAEPNYFIKASSTVPNDTDFQELWAFNNTGQIVNGVSGTADADMDAVEAWDTSTGSSGVVVAVLDTGIDLDHEDLSGNIWVNPGETPGDGIDNDGNGYIDDVNGWDFVNNDNDPDDNNDHGTFIAGAIGAVGNNAKGISGVNWSVKMLPLKVLDSTGTGTVADAISGINYASDKNIKIINGSWTTSGYSALLKSAIENSSALFVTPAGNYGDGLQLQGWDIDASGQEQYPASFDSSNVIAAGSTDQNDALPGFSNYGTTSVDVAAPGDNIYSTERGDTYDYASGTSVSCALTSGLAALILAVKSGLTTDQIKSQIINSVDVIAGLSGKSVSGGRINAYEAITVPEAPSGFSAASASSSQINLSWNDTSGNELGFKIERKTASTSFTEIATVSKNTTSYGDSGLSASTTYTYRVQAYNNIGNSSYTSNASATTGSGSSGGGGGGGGGGCFIATAAFGSPLSKEVTLLSRYRDVYLMNSAPGRYIVAAYYKWSPPLARRIRNDRVLKWLCRCFLRFVVFYVHLLVGQG